MIIWHDINDMYYDNEIVSSKHILHCEQHLLLVWKADEKLVVTKKKPTHKE